jgi:hypothetical protein
MAQWNLCISLYDECVSQAYEGYELQDEDCSDIALDVPEVMILAALV